MFKIGDVLKNKNNENYKVVVLGYDPITNYFNLADKYSYEDSFYDTSDNWEIDQPYDQIQKDNCWHNWSKYVGFTEKYQYCTKCDKKRGYDE